MKTLIIDTVDSRMFYTMKALEKRGFTAQSLNTFTSKNEGVIYCFSPSKRWGIDDVEKLNNDSSLLTGAVPDNIKLLLEDKKIIYHNVLLDEIFAIENAIQTAEATLMLIIRGTVLSIFKQKYLIYGYGRVGKAVAKVFNALGLDIAIATNDYYERANAHIVCNKVYDINAPIDNVDVIINTIPAKIFSEEKIRKLANCTYILDLASFSVVDNRDVVDYQLNYNNALGLPGKYSPKSAGEILADCIENIIN